MQLLVFDDLEVPTHKTKNIVNWATEMENAKKFLLVDDGPINEKLKLATQNLHYVNVLPSIVSFSILSLMCMYVWKLATLVYIYWNVPKTNQSAIFWFILWPCQVSFFFQGLNVYSILLHDTLVMSRGAVNRIVERMHTPINRWGYDTEVIIYSKVAFIRTLGSWMI